MVGKFWLLVLLSLTAFSAAAEKIDGRSVWSDLPPLLLDDVTGAERALSEWKGKVLMVNFFATWCAPCRYEVPHLIMMQEEYGPQGLQIIGIGFDREEKVQNYVRSLEITYPVLVADPERYPKLMGQWGNTSGAIPYLFVVGQDGTVELSQNGTFTDRHFEWFVEPLLKGTHTNE